MREVGVSRREVDIQWLGPWSQSETPTRYSATFDGNLHPLASSNEHEFRCLLRTCRMSPTERTSLWLMLKTTLSLDGSIEQCRYYDLQELKGKSPPLGEEQ